MSVRKWTPPVERDSRKAARWRDKARARLPTCQRSMEPALEIDCSSDDTSRGCGAPNGGDTVRLVEARGPNYHILRPSRGSRRSKIMSLFSMNTFGRLAALAALELLGTKSEAIAAVAVQGHLSLIANLPDCLT